MSIEAIEGYEASMDLSIGAVARTLDVSENTVRDFIETGKLYAERKGRHLFVSESSLRAFMEAEKRLEERFEEEEAVAAAEQSGSSLPTALPKEMLRPIMYRLAAMQKQLEERLELFEENQRLHEELLGKEREQLRKENEVAELRRDLAYHKRVLEKELEDAKIVLEEKWAVLQKEASERLALERARCDEVLEQRERYWTEKLAEEQARFVRQLEDARSREGLWSRLIKMMTWS
jgi:excisionase family DNA binding protein